MLCPTCNASQDWSATCRRCRCDLTLLWESHRACENARRQALAALKKGHFQDAVRFAAKAYAWEPSDAAARLLAACHLYSGNMQVGWELAAPLVAAETAGEPPAEVEFPAPAAQGNAVDPDTVCEEWAIQGGWNWRDACPVVTPIDFAQEANRATLHNHNPVEVRESYPASLL